jgi:uncharacterized membrane protein
VEETGIVLRPFVNPWLIGGVAVLVAVLVVFGYQRTTRPVSRPLKRFLVLLHLIAAAALLICLLRPSLQLTHYELVKRPVLMLVDGSRSMTEISDTPGGVTRIEQVNELLSRHRESLDALAERYELQALDFGRGLLPETGSPDPMDVRYTAYGRSLEQGFTEAAGGQSDAVVIIGDGAHNFGPPDPLDVAASLNEQAVPVYTVGIGQDQATSGLRDVKVLDVQAPKAAYLFTSFPIRARVLFRGCKGLSVRTHLDYPDQEPQSQSIVLAHDEEVVPLEFYVVPDKPGEYKAVFRSDVVPNEVLDANNLMSVYVRVLQEGVRVGLLDTVRPESKFVARALATAEQVRLRRVLLLAGQHLPRGEADVDLFDVVVLGDLEPGVVKSSRLLEIRNQVRDAGRGLIVLLAPGSRTLDAWENTSLEALLPVSLPGRGDIVDGERRFLVPQEYADHPIVSLASDEGEELEWEAAPPLAGAVRGLQPKRGATVLAADQEGNPLLVVHRFGQGRVACVAADTTFRWYFTDSDTQDLHLRFWRQLVLWAAGREDERTNKLRLEISKQRVLVEEELRVTARLIGEDGTPVRTADLKLRLTDPQGNSSDMDYAFSSEEGGFVAEYAPLIAGDYTVSAQASPKDGKALQETGHFHASDQDVELEDPAADLRLLRRMAAATQEAGGRYCHPDRFGELLDELLAKGEPLALTTRRREDAWDDWPLFALFAACLVTEWATRKFRGLL